MLLAQWHVECEGSSHCGQPDAMMLVWWHLRSKPHSHRPPHPAYDVHMECFRHVADPFSPHIAVRSSTG